MGRAPSIKFHYFVPVTSDVNTPYQQVRQPTTPLYSRYYSNVSRLSLFEYMFCFSKHSILLAIQELSKAEIKKKNFRRSTSATLLCVYVERREVSLSNCLLCCDWGGASFPWGFLLHSRNFLAISFGSFWTQFGESCIFVRSNLLLSGTEPRCSLYTRPTPPFLSDHLPAK